MHIVDLSPEHERAYLHCLEPWAEEVARGAERKRAWVEKMRDRGLVVRLAIDDDGEVAGMIQALPIEETHVLGRDLYFILCIWVHGHKEGIGDRRGRGIGTALLEALEEAVRERGAKGLAAWGLALPMWMRASWFRKHGFDKADRDGIARLVYKPFAPDVDPPQWVKTHTSPLTTEGTVTVTCYTHGWCSLQNGICECGRQVAAEFEGVQFTEVDTSEPAAARALGQTDALYVDGRLLSNGPPLSEEKIRTAIRRAVDGPWYRRLVGSGSR